MCGIKHKAYAESLMFAASDLLLGINADRNDPTGNMLDLIQALRRNKCSHLICFGSKLQPLMLTCQDNEAAFKQFYKHSATVSAVKPTDCCLFKHQFTVIVKFLHW